MILDSPSRQDKTPRQARLQSRLAWSFSCLGYSSADIAPLVRARPRALHLDCEQVRTPAYPPWGRGYVNASFEASAITAKLHVFINRGILV